MKGDRPRDKCKDTIFKRILQKWIDSAINEYTNLFEAGNLASCGRCHDSFASGQS
jgi:hypothetical protein